MYVVLRVQCKRICGQQPLFLVYRGLVKWYDRGLQNLWWEFDSLIPCSWRVGKLVKRVLFGSFDLTGSVTDHIKSVKIGGKTSIFLSFVLKQS